MPLANKPRKKKPLNFVAESDKTVKLSEEETQLKNDAENNRRNNKSLQEQLRQNSIKRFKEASKKVRERDSFNRLSKNQLEFYEGLKKKDLEEKQILENYINNKGVEFEKKRKFVENSKINKSSTIPKVNKIKPIKGIVKKDKNKSNNENK